MSWILEEGSFVWCCFLHNRNITLLLKPCVQHLHSSPYMPLASPLPSQLRRLSCCIHTWGSFKFRTREPAGPGSQQDQRASRVTYRIMVNPGLQCMCERYPIQMLGSVWFSLWVVSTIDSLGWPAGQSPSRSIGIQQPETRLNNQPSYPLRQQHSVLINSPSSPFI